MADTASTEPKQDSKHFQFLVTCSMALVTVWAAIVGTLQAHASNGQNEANQRNQTQAVSALGELLRVEQKTAHEVDLYTRWYEASEQARQARAAGQASRLQGDEAAALEHDQTAERWDAVAAQLVPAGDLLSDPQYEYDDRIYREQSSRDAYMEIERQEAAGREFQDWGSKADSYVAVLTTLAVVLFLFGLSLTIENWLRFMFVGVGWMMTVATGVWVLWVAVVPVHVTPEEAMQHLVEGQIAANVGYFSFGDAQSEWYGLAVDELTQAIELDDRYAAAYVWRAQAQLDSRLRDRRHDNAGAAEDFRRAIELGSDTPIVNGNLSWAAFLAGDYEGSIAAARRAATQDPTQCVAHLNLGLALLASGQLGESDAAYDEAVRCVVDGPVQSRVRLFDAGIADLMDLQALYPDTPGVDDTLLHIKELAATYELFGDVSPRDTDVTIGDVWFAEDVGLDGVSLGVSAELPPGTPNVYTFFAFEGVSPDTAWLIRWYHDGDLYDTFEAAEWVYGDSGETYVRVSGSPMPAGQYEVEFYFDGRLVTTATFDVQAGDAVSMEPYVSSLFQLTINRPPDWSVSEEGGEDGSLIISRDDLTYLYYFTTAYTGTSDDLLNGMRALWEESYPDVTFDEPGSFYLGGLSGARYVHAWHTDADGNEVLTYLMGTVDETGLARVVWLQLPQDGAEQTYIDYFSPMIKSLRFGETVETVE